MSDERREATIATASEPSEALARIAALLDVPGEAMTDRAQAPVLLKGAVELLQIWSDLTSDAARERLLALAREVQSAG